MAHDKSGRPSPTLTQFPALRATALSDAPTPPDVQRLWFTLVKRPWSFLVVMPAHSGGNVVELARSLAAVGTQHRGTPVRFIDASNVLVASTSQTILEAVGQNEGSTVVAVDCPLLSPAAIPIALAADGVLLAVELGRADIDSARKTVDAIGRERSFGTVTVGSNRTE